MIEVGSYVGGVWMAPGEGARDIHDAITGARIGRAGNAALDAGAMLEHGRRVGGPVLRAMGFKARAKMLKALALHLSGQKEALYELSYTTGGTAVDHMIDVDGGIGTLFVYASKGVKELPEDGPLLDGDVEFFGKAGSFGGRHICVPLQGVAVHINAFNFPVWGMLEKIAPCLLAGVPAIVKPATATAHVTEACVRMMLEAGVLPEGALQLVTGGLGDTLERLGPQDVVTFTGSAETALKLRGTPALLRNSVRFTAEQDSLNASILGPDAGPDSPEFDLFVKEVHREMTAKAGQKCTAIRRILVPEAQVDAVIEAVSARLAKTTVGDPREEGVRMGALVSAAQAADVLEKAAIIGSEAELVFGGMDGFAPLGERATGGAFVAPHLFRADPDSAQRVHDTEAFGPVSTVMGYRDMAHACEIAARGQGSLVASVITHDPAVAREAVMGLAPWHGRVYLNDRVSMKESTGHGAPMPHMVHGGPGRAGGGEELGGIRAVTHYMQRTAVQGSPEMLRAVSGVQVKGAPEVVSEGHPFRRKFGELEVGQVLQTASREITLEDIEHFAEFTGDTFYAHMNEEAAARNPFFPGRVAHGYLLLSFAAGLFVDPEEGPVLANTGLEGLAFMQPVVPGDSISVRLTVASKKRRTAEHGEVRWAVEITNQEGATVAEYELLTMVAG
ncbi:MAG: phenylacetic acid degradation bifunctional protein PaaZ [Vannielia sp.]|uniref:phenylacetic acid degradation bifunctional protein PaaZ n=1 Tax=Vannielia sp. TaxID=2813045 RepID=UPI003B8C845B